MEVNPIRVTPLEAKQAVDSGALFVSAYDGQKFDTNKLPGAMPAGALAAMSPQLNKDREIVIYCGWEGQASSASLAAKYLSDGFNNVKIVDGGIEAWRAQFGQQAQSDS